MKIRLIHIGKTVTPYIKTGIDHYLDRLRHYCSFEIISLADVKRTRYTPVEQLKQAEGRLILKQVNQPHRALLLDEKGKQYTSLQFADFFQTKMNSGMADIDFIIGGAFGFSEEVYSAIKQRLSFSKMTLSHELIRLVFCEQLYRAMTILKNEPYHHE